MDAFHATRLQENGESVGLAECGQPGAVTVAQRLQLAEHQRDAAEIFARVAGDEFDLRDVLARVQAFDQGGQLRHLAADLRNDRVAFGQVGDEARVLFTETD